MPESEFVRTLLVYGIAALKGNEKEEARSHLNRVLYQTDASVEQKIEAWWWLSQIAEKPDEKRELLQNILQVDSMEPRARREMAVLLGKLKPEDVLGPHEISDSLPAVMASSDFKAHRFVCPQCGGRVSYLVSQQEIRCRNCGVPLRDLQPARVLSTVEEQDFYADLPTVRARGWKLPPEREVKCQGCGATFFVPEHNVTASCPYCESPYAIESVDETRLICPQGVVTFRIDEENALERARIDLTGRSFLKPNRAELGPPRGVYMPFWTFDIRGELHWKRRRSKMSQQRWENRLTPYEHNPQEEEKGRFPVNYNDSLIPAACTLPVALLHRIADFDTGEAVPYNIGLLAGWTTEIYQVTMASASVKAHQLAYERAKEDFLGTLSPFDSLSKPTFSSSGISIDTYKLLLLPIWKIASCLRDQRSIVLVNGQTGTVAESALSG
jgi:DNA-directed RNA polymerase subunit RPC12/RpoP